MLNHRPSSKESRHSISKHRPQHPQNTFYIHRHHHRSVIPTISSQLSNKKSLSNFPSIQYTENIMMVLVAGQVQTVRNWIWSRNNKLTTVRLVIVGKKLVIIDYFNYFLCEFAIFLIHFPAIYEKTYQY